jgi:hypothetical protein
MRSGQWRPATKDKTEYEIKKHLVSQLKDTPLRKIGTFEIQMLLNDLARESSQSIVKHAHVNLRSIMRMAQKLKFIAENPGEDTKMPETKAVSRSTMTRIHPIAHKLGIPRKLVSFQVMRRTVGTDLQKHGTMKDAQQILRHANIQTTANVYMQQIPTSVMEGINSRTRAILASRKPIPEEISNAMGSNGLQLESEVLQVPEKNGSSGRTRTYNPPVNSRMLCH